METKKVFVLGNGFDLAHYLPTAYIYFMEAMKVVENSQPNTSLSFDDLFKTRIENNDWFFLRTKELYKTDELILSAEIVDNLREKLKFNGWFQHFKHHLNDVDTWIDFETEIENVLVNFDWVFKTDFEIGTIKSKFHNDEKLAAEKVFKFNEVTFNVSFFEKFGIRSKTIVKLFSTFGFFRSDFAYKKVDSWGNEDFEAFADEKEYLDSSKRYKFKFENIIKSDLLRRMGNNYYGFYESKLFRELSEKLNKFSFIFSFYISEFINKLSPKNEFILFGDISDIEMVFTFNYSNTFQRFYANQQNKSDITKHLHGDAEKGNIVFGISDLDKNLKKYKIFEFVKTYQKIINKTDYQFLNEDKIKRIKLNDASVISSQNTFEIVIWGHSLDISDKEYIEELFSLNQKNANFKTVVKVLFHSSPHDSLANLMNILGKDLIQNWVKNEWLIFEKSPDIYQIHHDHYKDKEI